MNNEIRRSVDDYQPSDADREYAKVFVRGMVNMLGDKHHPDIRRHISGEFRRAVMELADASVADVSVSARIRRVVAIYEEAPRQGVIPS